MTTTRHVLVGTGIAAISAAEAIRRTDPRVSITMIGSEAGHWYSRPGLAYLLTGEIPAEGLMIRTPAEVTRLGVTQVSARVVRIEPANRWVVLDGGDRVHYDRLLLATGAASITPPFPGASLRGVMRLDAWDDARELLARARPGGVAVVAGGGSTALELVEGLHARGMETHYLMRGARYWSRVLDPVESAMVEARLLADGVQLHRHTAIRAVTGDARDQVTGVDTEDGRHLPCDLVAVAVGVRPNVALAREAGIATDRGILTSEFMETSVPDVYAAGDAAQVHDPVTRRSELDTLWASAQSQGTIAGMNMAGQRVPHRTRPPINVTRLGGITATIVGRVGGAGSDPDLLTLTRGQSERWAGGEGSWSIGGARAGDRLRVVVSGRAIVGAVVMGDQGLSRPLAHLIGEAVDISALRPALDASPERAMDILLDFCADHVGDRTAAHR
ncbi:MAG TPA: FAD-dependent oxidoreductase [Gemmatimonadaceae bacterium]